MEELFVFVLRLFGEFSERIFSQTADKKGSCNDIKVFKPYPGTVSGLYEGLFAR